MAHVPHLHLPGPWDRPEIELPAATAHHLLKVLRRPEGAPVTYTDGTGVTGSGTVHGSAVRRGEERDEPAPDPAVTLAVAAPRSADRSRYLVEKLAELGVNRLVWAITEHGQARPPKPAKAAAWAIAALEQSRAAHVLAVDGPSPLRELSGPLWVADPEGGPPPAGSGPVTVLVGPEGGLADGEAPAHARLVSLGRRVLRTETAAVAAAILALQAVGRFPALDGRRRNRAGLLDP